MSCTGGSGHDRPADTFSHSTFGHRAGTGAQFFPISELLEVIRTLKCEELSLCITLDTSRRRMAAGSRGGRLCVLIGCGGRGAGGRRHWGFYRRVGGVGSDFVCLGGQRSVGKEGVKPSIRLPASSAHIYAFRYSQSFSICLKHKQVVRICMPKGSCALRHPSVHSWSSCLHPTGHSSAEPCWCKNKRGTEDGRKAEARLWKCGSCVMK